MLAPTPPDPIIKLAILAVGGQGGGVVSDWIVELAERNGWYAQSTSVPGVAQRTGATIYYIEMVREGDGTPILSLMPAPGDVDIVLAAELMEAGRAMQRGLVTPDRTTLITSTHRTLAVSEKVVPGSGITDPTPVLDAARKSSKRFLGCDLERLAVQNGSVISASLFGALAAAEVLPFPREAFEATIEAGGRGAAASLKAFRAGYEATQRPESEGALGLNAAAAPPPKTLGTVHGPERDVRAWASLIERVTREFPEEARSMLLAGLEKVTDFQDVKYGREYLDRLKILQNRDKEYGGTDHALPVHRRSREIRRQRHGLRRRDPRRRPENPRLALPPHREGDGCRAGSGPAPDRVHASAHRGGVRHDAGRARRASS